MSGTMRTSNIGLEHIKSYEKCILKPYKCSAGKATIGWGNTFYLDGRRVKITDHPITQAKADALFLAWVGRFETAINKFASVPLQQCMFDALVSLVYNIGIEAFKESTLLRKLNAGDYLGAADEFLKWNKVKGVTSDGLKSRRAKEAAMFRGDAAI